MVLNVGSDLKSLKSHILDPSRLSPRRHQGHPACGQQLPWHHRLPFSSLLSAHAIAVAATLSLKVTWGGGRRESASRQFATRAVTQRRVVEGTFSGGAMIGSEGGAGAGGVGRNLELIWVDLPCHLFRSSLLRGRLDSLEGRPCSPAAFLAAGHARRLRLVQQIQHGFQRVTWGLLAQWYVSNVSIIFYAPCLFIYYLLCVLLHFMVFLCIFRN
jgi:hypothetical protein